MALNRKHLLWPLCIAALVAMLIGTILLVSRKTIYQGKDVETWSWQLASSDHRESGEAEVAFRAMGSNAVTPLIRMLRARDSAMKSALCRVVARIAPSVPGGFGKRLATISKPVNYEAVHYNAAWALTIIGTNAVGAVPALADEVRRARQPALWQAGHALAAIGKPSVPVLIELTTNQDDSIRHAAVLAISKIGSDAAEAAPLLVPLLADKHKPVRACALSGLGTIGSASIAPLLEALRSGQPLGRAAAAGALIAIRPAPRLITPSLLQMATNANAELRREALRVLGSIHAFYPEAIAVYSKALQDSDPTVRVAAAKALYGIAPLARSSLPDLIEALNTDDAELCELSAQTLGRMGATASVAVPQLEAQLKSDYEPVRVAAQNAIAKIRSSQPVK